MSFSAKNIPTTAFTDQKPGTSGLRKKTKIFTQPRYLDNFVQAVVNVVVKEPDFVLVVGGDGRYYNKHAITDCILPIAAANGIKKVIVGRNGILSTPAASHIIRKYGANGGIILTASHNPGGINEDFGIKYNVKNGGPAPENVTDAIFEESTKISSINITDRFNVDLSRLHETKYISKETGKDFVVCVIDSVTDYCKYMKEIFDFDALKRMITGKDGYGPVNVLVNALNGVMGVYVTEIFCTELGVPIANAENCIPLEDFGGRHPDPNLTYAKDLVIKMTTDVYDIGCAFDGDGDRNMILGKHGFFVSPCDSLAAVADNVEAIKYFQEHKVHGFARSMPTSSAVDKVAKTKNIQVFEVPTGWKFFGNLMDTNQLSLCGEESFGMGSDHIREKDGMWSVLAWLSILCKFRQSRHKHVSLKEIMEEHWGKYGRNFFTRYDYENCTSEQGDKLMKVLLEVISNPNTVKKEFEAHGKKYTICSVDNFEYIDPVDGSHSKNQGIRVIFTDGSRLIYRLSGTGSSGATVRLYIDSYQNEPSSYSQLSEVVLKPLVEIGLRICQIREIAGREQPTVIT